MPVTTKHEFTYDIKLVAVIRVSAESKAQAEGLIADALDHASLVLERPHDDANSITNSMIFVDDETGPYLVEIDGVPVDF